jgi:hypothetical protein
LNPSKHGSSLLNWNIAFGWGHSARGNTGANSATD